MLGDLDLLDELTEGGTVASTVLTDDAGLLSALTLGKFVSKFVVEEIFKKNRAPY